MKQVKGPTEKTSYVGLRYPGGSTCQISLRCGRPNLLEYLAINPSKTPPMYTFIDESGSFASASKRNAWNVVVAYMTPESEQEHVRNILFDLKATTGSSQTQEIKLRHVNENDYMDFLQHLSQCQGILFAVATDAGKINIKWIMTHRNHQATEIVKHIDVMRYESGKVALRNLAARVQCLSPQLYIQLNCQVILIDSIIRYGVLYFVQRLPEELGNFSWRIDQKGSRKTEFEKAFETMTPAWLQSHSLEKPMMMMKGADYSAFKRFGYPNGEAPTYLQTVYNIDVNTSDSTDIGKLVREDLQFVDSKQDSGIQVADLLASGLRRCLRGGFSRNGEIACLFGRLMVEREMNTPPVPLLGFENKNRLVTRDVAGLLHNMRTYSKPMLVR